MATEFKICEMCSRLYPVDAFHRGDLCPACKTFMQPGHDPANGAALGNILRARPGGSPHHSWSPEKKGGRPLSHRHHGR